MPRALVTALILVAPAFASGGDTFPVASPESQGLSTAALEALSAEVESYLERDLIVGCELLVIKNRRTVWHESFGFSDRVEDEAWVNGTVCNIRSMTKPLTGAAAQLLVDRGLLALEDPVAQYLPGFDTDEARAITVRQLLTHRSGLPLTILTSMDEYDDLYSLANAAGVRGPEFEPGSRFWYSDAGTDVLAAVVEVVAETTIDQFVLAELLVPLGMRDSFYFIDDEDPRRSGIASMYGGGVGNWQRFLDPDDGAFYPFAWGSQTLYSTPQDYASFLAMWMDRGCVGDWLMFSEEAVQRALTPANELTMMGSETRFPTSFKGLEVFYGQMFVLHTQVGVPFPAQPVILGHSGSDGTIAWAWPERDLMVLFFTQSRGGGAVLRLEGMLDRQLIAPELYADEVEVPADLRPYLGTYIADWANHMREEFVVEYSDGALRIDVPSQMLFELKPIERGSDDEGLDRKWAFAIAPVITVWFERDEAGEVDCLRIHQSPLTFEAPRRGTPHALEYAVAQRPDLDVVGKYLGQYDVSEDDGPAEVLIESDYLAIRNWEGHLFHLWEVPGAGVWQVRENPMITVSFQIEGGVVTSFTRRFAGGGELVCPRVE